MAFDEKPLVGGDGLPKILDLNPRGWLLNGVGFVDRPAPKGEELEPWLDTDGGFGDGELVVGFFFDRSESTLKTSGLVNPNGLGVAEAEGAKPFTDEVVVGAGGVAFDVADGAPNTDVVVSRKPAPEAVVNAELPKGEGVPKTFGVVAIVEKAETGLIGGAAGGGAGGGFPNAEAVGCGPKLVDNHSVPLGFSGAGAARDSSLVSCCSSSSSISSCISSCISSSMWCSYPPSDEIPSMISGISKFPRIASMSSIASFPKRRSRIQATR